MKRLLILLIILLLCSGWGPVLSLGGGSASAPPPSGGGLFRGICSFTSSGAVTSFSDLTYSAGTNEDAADCTAPLSGDLVVLILTLDGNESGATWSCTDDADATTFTHGVGAPGASRGDVSQYTAYHTMSSTGTTFDCSWTVSSEYSVVALIFEGHTYNTTADTARNSAGFGDDPDPLSLAGDQGTDPVTWAVLSHDNKTISACPTTPSTMIKAAETIDGSGTPVMMWACYFDGALSDPGAFTSSGLDGYVYVLFTVNP